jgi:hypothetical protein
MMVPRVRPWRRWFSAPYDCKETSAGSQLHRQLCFIQGSGISSTATLSRIQGSGSPPTATLSHIQGSGSPLTATLACTQGSGTSLPDTLAPSYTPHCTSGPSPCIYNREVQGLPGGGFARRDELTNRLPLSPSRRACIPYYKHPGAG